MRKIVYLLMVFAIVFSFSGVVACDDNSTAEVTWRLNTFGQEADPQTAVLHKFADLVKDKSDGRMEIKVFSGGTLYDQEQSFDAVKNGKVDVAWVPQTYLIGNCPTTGFSLACKLTTTYDDFLEYQKAVLKADIPAIKKELDDNNIMLMLYINAGYIEWFFDRPVETMEDVEGLKISSYGGSGNYYIESLGGVPKQQDISEAYLAADQGQVDGLIGPDTLYESMKLYEVLPYFVVTELMPGPTPLSFHTPSFEALPEDLQTVVMNAAAEAEEWGTKYVADARDVQIQNLIDDPDVTVYKLPEAERMRWFNDAISPTSQGSIIGQFGMDLLIQLQTIAAEVTS